jgi:DNA polymerase (family 10)
MPVSRKKKMARAEVLKVFKRLQKAIKPKLEVAGSLRRGKVEVGDLDVLVWGPADVLTKVKGAEVTESGPARTTIVISGVQVNAYRVEKAYHGAMLMYLTGPGRWNIGMRIRAKKRGLKLSQYGVFPRKTPSRYDTRTDPEGLRVAGLTEAEVFEALGKPFKAPELRGVR